MKRILLIGLCAVLLMGIVYGSAKKITRVDRVITDTIVNSDTETRLSDKIILTVDKPSGDINYDQIIAGFFVPDMVQISAVAGEGLVDSVILRLLSGTGNNVDTLVSVTKTSLPATFNINYAADSIGMSRGGLANDHLWFSAYVVDTAGSGTGDSLTYSITYWIKLIERK